MQINIKTIIDITDAIPVDIIKPYLHLFSDNVTSFLFTNSNFFNSLHHYIFLNSTLYHYLLYTLHYPFSFVKSGSHASTSLLINWLANSCSLSGSISNIFTNSLTICVIFLSSIFIYKYPHGFLSP